MARRLEIELTSARPDGTWTWRAAGARNPRGYLDSALLYEGAKVGDVVRAEAEFALEGISVVAVEPPKPPEAPDPNLINLVERPLAAGVTTQLRREARPQRPDGRASAPGRARRSEDRRAGPQREAASQHDGPQSTLRPGGRPPGRPGQRPRPAREAGAAGAQEADAPGAAANGTGHTGGPAAERPGRGPARGRPSAGTPRQGERPLRGGRARPAGAEEPAEAAAGRAQGERSQHRRRLSPANVHRNALLEGLPPEQRPIAQQLMRGGIPAVRTALYFERERAREEGRPEPSTEGVLAIAESLVSKVKAAEWRDRAEAALRAGDSLLTRDLRSLVSSSDVARDEASRELASALREMLERRVEAAREAWSTEVGSLLDQGQVVRALRLSARPPDPGARLSAELAVRLRDAAGEALAPELSPAQWLDLLVAVSESPVRRVVKPKGLPPSPPPELLDAARQQCGRVPGLAPLLGMAVPPPPGPLVRPKPLQRPPAARRRQQGQRRQPSPPQGTNLPAPPAKAETSDGEATGGQATDANAEAEGPAVAAPPAAQEAEDRAATAPASAGSQATYMEAEAEGQAVAAPPAAQEAEDRASTGAAPADAESEGAAGAGAAPAPTDGASAEGQAGVAPAAALSPTGGASPTAAL